MHLDNPHPRVFTRPGKSTTQVQRLLVMVDVRELATPNDRLKYSPAARESVTEDPTLPSLWSPLSRRLMDR